MTTKPNTECESKRLCVYEPSGRTRFFHGMLLTEQHLLDEQTYHRNALRRVTRYLWGHGVVCGFEVESTAGMCIKIHPGLALDCQGQVIELCKAQTIDLWDECRKKMPRGCDTADAPKPFDKYLAVRYVEIADDPEPVLAPPDDCGSGGDTACEASRVREGFCFLFLDECPKPTAGIDSATDAPIDTDANGDAYAAANADADADAAAYDDESAGANGINGANDAYAGDQTKSRLAPCMQRSPPCPECACDCGCGEHRVIVLARLRIDCAAKRVGVSCEYREYVPSPRRLLQEARRERLALRAELRKRFQDIETRLQQVAAQADSSTKAAAPKRPAR